MAEKESGRESFRLIVGLGNPGRRYKDTRHNVGFRVVELLARHEGLDWRHEKKWETDVARGAAFACAKPQTFMNLSGRSVAGLALFYKVSPSEVLVIHDDVDLPLGALRFRASGSAGGHNGISSIIQSLGSDGFARLKVGVGRGAPGGERDLADHVLSKFLVDEAAQVEKTLDRAVEAVRTALAEGLEAAMNEYNRKPGKKRVEPATESPEAGEGKEAGEAPPDK